MAERLKKRYNRPGDRPAFFKSKKQVTRRRYRMKVLARSIFCSLMVTATAAYVLAEDDIPFNDLTVQFDLERSTISGVSIISLPAGRTARINLAGIR